MDDAVINYTYEYTITLPKQFVEDTLALCYDNKHAAAVKKIMAFTGQPLHLANEIRKSIIAGKVRYCR